MQLGQAMVLARDEHRQAKMAAALIKDRVRTTEAHLEALRRLADRYRDRAAAPTCGEDARHRGDLLRLAERVDELLDGAPQPFRRHDPRGRTLGDANRG